jgi:D-alanine-D-alanine ligase
MKVAVVHDSKANSEEMEMIEAVSKAISSKYDTTVIEFGNDFINRIKEYDFVFNLSTHGGIETRQVCVPALLDMLEIPYTSSNVYSHSLCMNKKVTKLVLDSVGVPVPKTFDSERYEKGTRFMVKPSMEGSAKGISKDSVVQGKENIKIAIKKIEEEFNQPAVAEEFIEGKELSVGLIGNGNEVEILPILEIDFSGLPEGMEKFYSFRVKHNYGKMTKYICPAHITENAKRNIENYAKKAFKNLNLRDYARMDIRLKDDIPYFIEVNSMPQLVPVYSDIVKMGEAAGYFYNDFILKITDISMKRWGLK